MSETHIDQTVDVTEWPKEKQQEWAKDQWNQSGGGIEHLLTMQFDLAAGVEIAPQEFTSTYHGDSLEEALGRAYTLRDQLRDSGVECSVEATGKKFILPSTNFYEFHVTIGGGE